MSFVFISHAHEDVEVARELSAALKAHGITVFLDSVSIVSGERYSKFTRDALMKSRAVVVLLSKHSRRNNWVQDEVRTALENVELVIPILLDEDATQNWLWPLLSDREAVRLDPKLGVPGLVQDIENVLSTRSLSMDTPASMGPPALRRGPRWVTVAVLLAGALVGGLVAYLIMSK